MSKPSATSELARLKLIEAGARDSEELVKVLTEENAALKARFVPIAESALEAGLLGSMDRLLDPQSGRGAVRLSQILNAWYEVNAQLTASRAEAARALDALRQTMDLVCIARVYFPQSFKDDPVFPAEKSEKALVAIEKMIEPILNSSTATQWLHENYIPRSEVEAMQRKAVEMAIGIIIAKIIVGGSPWSDAETDQLRAVVGLPPLPSPPASKEP